MSNWNDWECSYQQLKLEEDGDGMEKLGFTDHSLNTLFPNYEKLWRYHIAPSTNRPANIRFRDNTDSVISHMAQLSNNLLFDIIRSSSFLIKVKNGDYGEVRNGNAFDCLEKAGNAIQKFTDLQKHIEKELLSKKLSSDKKIWDNESWQTIWKPRRERVISYRNFLTHTGPPEVITVSSGSRLVLSKDAFFEYSGTSGCPVWEQQQDIYAREPEKWSQLADVVEQNFLDSVEWINDAYNEIIICLEEFLVTDEYHKLWGWDTGSYMHPHNHLSGAVGAQGSI